MNTGLVFLDFDGVLTSARVNIAQTNADYDMWSKFDSVTVDFLNKLHNTFDIRFVWNTTWMHGMANDNAMNYHWAYTMFRNAGFTGRFNKPWRVNPDDVVDMTTSGGKPRDYRAQEMLSYLKDYEPGVWDAKAFMVLDDLDFDYNKVLGVKRWIHTDSDNGMLLKHYQKAWALAHNIFVKR